MTVRLLGPVEVTGPHGPAVFGGGRQRALVGALAPNAGVVVTSARLVDALLAPPDRPLFVTPYVSPGGSPRSATTTDRRRV